VRSIGVALLFVFACLSLVLATTTWWLHDTLLVTDRFVAVTAPLARNPAVQDSLVQATTAQVDEALDLGPIGRYVVAGIAREVYASDAFAQVWEGGMRFVHGQLVAVLRNDTKVAQLVDGKIVANLFPLFDAVFKRINGLNIAIGGLSLRAPTLTNPADPNASRAELSAALGRSLKPAFGVVPVADAPRLESAQRLVTLFDAFVLALFVVTGLLAILAVALARRRLAMVALLGLGALVALLAARLVVSAAADDLVTQLIGAGPGAIISGRAVEQVAASYREFARTILLLGLAATLIATVATWLVDRLAAPMRSGGSGLSRGVDGWFLALAGLSTALVALIFVGLTAATLVVVAVGYGMWLVAVIRARRRARARVAAPGA
jgi:hypothetical protein